MLLCKQGGNPTKKFARFANDNQAPGFYCRLRKHAARRGSLNDHLGTPGQGKGRCTSSDEPASKKIAVIVGASSGIGQRAALRVAERDAGVILTYHTHPNAAIETTSTIEGESETVTALPFDVGRSATFAAFADRAAGELNSRCYNRELD